jgi:hypothetical protein
MTYYISRNQQSFGPYSLEDLQRYVSAGQISPSDLAQGEGTGNWMPVSQILGGFQSANPAPPVPPQSFQSFPQQPAAYAQPPQYQQPQNFGMPGGGMRSNASSQYPDPPSMNWVLVLVLTLVTCGIFFWVWMFIQAAYASKIDRASKSMLFYAIGLPCVLIGTFVRTMDSSGLAALGPLINLAGVILVILGHFKLKGSLEAHFNSAEPVNLRLSAVMTFFFSCIYFQYHLNRISNWRMTGNLQ